MTVSGITSKFSPVEESQGLTSSKKKIITACEVDTFLMTPDSALDDLKPITLITRFWNGVTGIASSIWRVISGIATRVWGGGNMHSPSHSCSKSLLAFKKELIRCQRKTHLMTFSEIQCKTAYNKLPDPVKHILNRWMQQDMIQRIDAKQLFDIGSLANQVDLIYRNLPSVQLAVVKDQLSKAITDDDRLACLSQMIKIVISDFEPEVTDEILNAHMLAALDDLGDSLTEQLHRFIKHPLCRSESEGFIQRDDKYFLMIDKVMVSADAPNFSRLLIKSMPRSARMATILLRMRDPILNA